MMKNKSLWKGLIVMLAAAFVMLVMPVQKASAAGTTEGTKLKWGSSYSGSTETSKCYKYAFSLKQSGNVTFVFQVSDAGYAFTSMGKITVLDETGKEVYKIYNVGDCSLSLDLLAGNYTLRIGMEGGMDGCNFTFTPSFKPSKETKSEHAMAKNNEMGTATSYKIGKSVKGQLALNDDIDIYKMRVTKSQYLNLTVSSKLRELNINLVNTSGSRNVSISDIEAGLHKYRVFLPKGTYYVKFRGGVNYATDYHYTGKYSFRTSVTAIPKPTITKTKPDNKYKTMYIRCKKNSLADGYQFQIARDKKFKKGKKTKQDEYTGMYMVDLKKGTYYVRVRSYVKIDNYGSTPDEYYYSSWSKVKTVKIK
ncbi:hypothetical protein G4313_10265 [Coprococcus eutactus]|nr:hypothetical protein [Coprococcus eutactus]